MTFVRPLDRLEVDGFVTRMAAPDDRRSHVLALTAKALPIVECIYVLTSKIYDDLLLGISKAEGRQVLKQGANDRCPIRAIDSLAAHRRAQRGVNATRGERSSARLMLRRASWSPR